MAVLDSPRAFARPGAMSELRLLGWMRWRQLRNRLGHKGVLAAIRRHSVLKVAVVTGFALAFWWGLFFLFLDGLKFLNTFPELKATIMGLLFAMFFAALTLMLTFSNGIIAFSSLFKSEETDFLFSVPLRPESVFVYRGSPRVQQGQRIPPGPVTALPCVLCFMP